METSSGSVPERTAAMDPRIGDRAVELLRELDAQKTDEPEIAPLVSRLIARLIDLVFAALVFYWVLAGIGLGLLFGGRAEAPPRSESLSGPSPGEYAALLGGALLAVVVVEMAPALWWRQSLGKKLMGLRVTCDGSGEFASWWLLMLRTLAWAAPLVLVGALPDRAAVGGLLLLAALLVGAATLKDPSRRAPHDRLLHTRVMRPR
jgi:uncharacterized RDD family membrane protein YckC